MQKFLSLKKNSSRIAAAVLWFLIVTTLLCIPGTDLPKITWQDKFWFDKWIHIFLFLVLVLLWCRAYSGKKNVEVNSKKVFLRIMIAGFLYGIMMELVQKYFVLFRSFDLGDILADGLGAVTGYFISLKKSLQTKKPAL